MRDYTRGTALLGAKKIGPRLHCGAGHSLGWPKGSYKSSPWVGCSWQPAGLPARRRLRPAFFCCRAACCAAAVAAASCDRLRRTDARRTGTCFLGGRRTCTLTHFQGRPAPCCWHANPMTQAGLHVAPEPTAAPGNKEARSEAARISGQCQSWQPGAGGLAPPHRHPLLPAHVMASSAWQLIGVLRAPLTWHALRRVVGRLDAALVGGAGHVGAGVHEAGAVGAKLSAVAGRVVCARRDHCRGVRIRRQWREARLARQQGGPTREGCWRRCPAGPVACRAACRPALRLPRWQPAAASRQAPAYLASSAGCSWLSARSACRLLCTGSNIPPSRMGWCGSRCRAPWGAPARRFGASSTVSRRSRAPGSRSSRCGP